MPETRSIALGYRPYEWQAEAHRNKRQYTVLVVARQQGKTEYAIEELVQGTEPYPGALTIKSERATFLYVAPLQTQAKKAMWDRLKDLVRKVPGNEIKETDNYVEVPNAGGGRSRIYYGGADNPDAWRGLTLDGAVMDELAQMKGDTWESVVSIALLKRDGWAVFIGTVKGTDMLSELYHKAKAGIFGPAWTAMLFDVYQCAVFSPEKIAQEKEDKSDVVFRREWLCDFTVAAENQLISLESVTTACHRNPPPTAWDWSPKIIGVDVAYAQNRDRFVIWKRQGLVSFIPEVYRGIDNVEGANRTAAAFEAWNADMIFVDMGRGEGVFAMLRERKYPVIGVNFGGKPHHPRFANKKAEMYFDVEEYVRTEGSLPDDPAIRADFCSVRFKHQTSTDKILIVQDDNLASPDLLAGCALTFAETVRARRSPIQQGHKRPRKSVVDAILEDT